MKKAEELRKEYRREDFGRGVRGKYYREYMKGTNLVLLRPEVAQAPSRFSCSSAQDRRTPGGARRLTRVTRASSKRARRVVFAPRQWLFYAAHRQTDCPRHLAAPALCD